MVMLPSLDPDREALVRPKHVPTPSKRLSDASNSATPKLSTHLKAIALKRAEDVKCLVEDAASTMPPATSSSHSVTPAKRSQNTDSCGSGDDTDCAAVPKPPKTNDEIKQKHDRKGQDVDNFFSPKYSEPGIDGKPRTYRDCTLCLKKGPHKHFVKDLSMCCRHLEKDHEVSVDISDNCDAN